MMHPENFSDRRNKVNRDPLGVLHCSGCDFERHRFSFGNPRNRTYYEPIEGVPASLIQYCYCDQCRDLTKWFMGKGKVGFEISSEYTRKVKDLKEHIARKKSSFKFLFKKRKVKNSRIRKVEDQSNFGYYDLSELKRRLSILEATPEAGLKVSKEEQYYNELRPVPRCLVCGAKDPLAIPFDQWDEFPKERTADKRYYRVHYYFAPRVQHTCGGNIYLKRSIRHVPGHIHLTSDHQQSNTIHQYNQWGEVVNTIKKGKGGSV